MRGRIGLLLTVFAALTVLALPPWLALQEARRQAYAAESDQVRRYAADVLRRTDGTAQQIDEAFRQLRQSGFAPCSADSLDLMRQIDLGSSYLQAVGYVRDGSIVCSSMGGAPMVLGQPGFRTAAGVTRTSRSACRGNCP